MEIAMRFVASDDPDDLSGPATFSLGEYALTITTTFVEAQAIHKMLDGVYELGRQHGKQEIRQKIADL